MLAEAIRLARLGFAVHWLRRPDQGGKAPILKDWQQRPWTSPALLQNTYSDGLNLGIHTGWVRGALYCVVVLDLDNREAIDWARDNLPATPLRAATSQGEHWYYLHPGPDYRVGNRAHVGNMALDVRGDGGQVVAPPSMHPSGHCYRWIGESPSSGELTLPVWSPDWFPAPPSPASNLRPASRSAGHQSAAKAAEALRKMQPAVQGQNGSRACFIAAVMLFRRFGLDASTAYDLMWREYNPRCIPPWSEAEMLHKVRDAARSAGVSFVAEEHSHG